MRPYLGTTQTTLSSWLTLNSHHHHHHHHVCLFATRPTLLYNMLMAQCIFNFISPNKICQEIFACITTLLGALRCTTDVQLADGRAMLLKNVSSYVTKIHEAATVEGLYGNDVSGYQTVNSFLRTVRPLAPKMIFQLSNVKVAWTDKLTKQFRVPYPGQEQSNVMYQLYLRDNLCCSGSAFIP